MSAGSRHSEPTLRDLLEEMQALRAQVARLERAVQEPPLVDIQYLAWMVSASESTVRRRLKEYGIAPRNLHGQPWKEGDGPVRYSLDEWQERTRLHTRTVTRRVESHREA